MNTNNMLNNIAIMVHDAAIAKGWWDDERNIGELIALMHSELSEALEEVRKGKPNVYYDKNGKPQGVAVELIDTFIRIFDYLGYLEVDIDAIFQEKFKYNQTRPKKHGKLF